MNGLEYQLVAVISLRFIAELDRCLPEILFVPLNLFKGSIHNLECFHELAIFLSFSFHEFVEGVDVAEVKSDMFQELKIELLSERSSRSQSYGSEGCASCSVKDEEVEENRRE